MAPEIPSTISMEKDAGPEGASPDMDSTEEEAGSSGKASEEGGGDQLVRMVRGRKKRSRSVVTPPITPICNPQVGDIVWAKVKQSRWWPATLVNKDDCGKLVSLLGGRGTNFYTYWYGDGRISAVCKSNLVGFKEGYKHFCRPTGRKNFQNGVHLAISEFAKLQGLDLSEDVAKALAWADSGFCCPVDTITSPGIISQHVQYKLQTLRCKYEDDMDCQNNEGKKNTTSLSPKVLYLNEELDLFNSIRDGSTNIYDICIACGSKADVLREHPLFRGGICELCVQKLLDLAFSVGIDDVAFHCCICLCVGDLVVCGHPQCYRAYCYKCIGLKATLGVIDNIQDSDPWSCFLCEPYSHEMHGLLQPHTTQWKINMWRYFHSERLDVLKQVPLRIMCCDDSFDAAFKVLSSLKSMDYAVESVLLCNFNSNELNKLKLVLPKNVVCLESAHNYLSHEALSEFSPIHVVVSSSKEREIELLGEKFFLFYSILSTLNILNTFSMEPKVPLMWLFEVSAPLIKDYGILISRYMQFDYAEQSAIDHTNEEKTSVWTNIPSLWPSLEGAGVPPTQPDNNKMSFGKRVKRHRLHSEVVFEGTPKRFQQNDENFHVNRKRSMKRQLILQQNPRVTRSMSIK